MTETPVEMLDNVIQQNANRPAVADGGLEVSYAGLEKRITLLASELKIIGIGKADRVALLLPNGLEFVSSYFVIVTLGAIVVPLNDGYKQNELLYFIEECGVSLLITSNGYEELSHE